jgi:hypothetical protein
LYGMLKASYAEMLGLIWDALSKLRVFCTCDANLSHSCSGNSLSVVARAIMNVALNVWMALSAALTLWLCGSTNCMSHSFLVVKLGR